MADNFSAHLSRRRRHDNMGNNTNPLTIPETTCRGGRVLLRQGTRWRDNPLAWQADALSQRNRVLGKGFSIYDAFIREKSADKRRARPN
jgi:hypothetical protein